MKPVLYALLLFAVTASPSLSQNATQDPQRYGIALEAIFGMGPRLQALLNTTSDENFVVSPLSATVVVGQLMLGAEGEFQDRLYDLLALPRATQRDIISYYDRSKKNTTHSLRFADFHLQLSSLVKTLQRRTGEELFTLDLSNALFYNENIELKNYFEKFLGNFYDTEITPLDFNNDTTGIINDWAAEHTNGLIKKVVTSPPEPSTSALFYNSIYFRAEWEEPFPDELNKRGSFSVTENTTVETVFMANIVKSILYAATKEYQLVCLPYKNRELGMYVFLPTWDNEYKYDIKQFSEGLKLDEVSNVISSAREYDVVVKIPKLSLSNNLSILKPLQKYAFEEMQEEADQALDDMQDYKNSTPSVGEDIFLTAAAENADLRVSDIVQQTVFAINEIGTEAASITSSGIDYKLSKTFVLDRPFAFLIRHEATLATLYWGTISDPTRS